MALVDNDLVYDKRMVRMIKMVRLIRLIGCQEEKK